MRTGSTQTWLSKTIKAKAGRDKGRSDLNIDYDDDDDVRRLSPAPPIAHRSPSTLSTFSSLHLQLPLHLRPRADSSSAASYHSDRDRDLVLAASAAATSPHPFSAMVSAPLPVVSSRDHDDEAECPVCLEPLSFSFRLPGEKPHIVPECGHALHEACFTAVYGPPPSQSRTQGVLRKSNLGVCGVCRRPMKVGDGDSGKSNKLAALTGVANQSSTDVLYPGRETPTMRGSSNGTTSSYPHSRGAVPSAVRPYNPTEDDPVEHTPKNSSSSSEHAHHHYVVAPSIQVRSEFSSITRNLAEPTQALTCIVILELPSKRPSTHVPGPIIADPYQHQHQQHQHQQHQLQHRDSPESQGTYRTATHGHNLTHGHGHNQAAEVSDATLRRHATSPADRSVHTGSPSVRSADPYAPSLSDSTAYGPMSPGSSHDDEATSPFQSITEDLKNRIIDWKGHPLAGLGPLRLFDLLSVRRDSLVREFFVYLFKEAIICVAEEKKRSLGRLLSSTPTGGDAGAGSQPKGVLRLKGRIYIRHIRQVMDTSVAGELSLTIDMEDERLDSFILIFKDRSSLETWRSNISALVTYVPRAPVEQPLDMEEFGGSAKAARMLSGSTATTATSSDRDSLLHSSARSTQSSYTSHHGSVAARGHHAKLAPLDEDEASVRSGGATSSSTGVAAAANAYMPPPPPPASQLYAPHVSAGPSNGLAPLPHPPVDLLLIVSLPPATTLPATAALKLRVIRASLDFVLASLGPRDRLAVVTFEVGMGGPVRKTPLLSVGKTQSRARLARFVDETGYRAPESSSFDDEFLIRGPKDEKTDVVTAVNHALDVVLQRKSRNPVTGMVLVSDAADSTRRAQMDLVLARAEAANVPIHSFGYGRSHDPASLWLMSNHTNGTYTFVKDWYDLRDCLAGCIGGMMSIGSMNMKLHMKIVDGNRFRIRKVSGGPSSIVASDGRNVDVDVGELRYGERKEMLVELELDNGDIPPAAAAAAAARQGTARALNATDRFNQSLGLDALAIEETDLMDGVMDRMIDEVPVFEVDGAFFDPAAAKHVSRLAHPVLLTVTLLPPTAGVPARPPASASDPVIVRRRMELLASDMITRALVLVSRKNYPQAQKIIAETKRILLTVLQTISAALPPPSGHQQTTRNRREALTLGAVRVLQAVLADMQILADALEENVELFAHDQRNFGAQQAMILRDQKAWTGRSATERVFWTVDNSIELVGRSTDWVARE